ncbi:hypothetical protein D3C84_958420 [compost metagenome]
MGLDLTLGRAAVQGQHRNVRLVGQADGVAHGLGVGRVDQDGVDLAHGEIFHVGELLGRIVLGVQHHQLVAKLLGLGFGPFLHGDEEGVVEGGHHHGQGVIGSLGSAQHGHDGGGEQGIELFHRFIPCVCITCFCYRSSRRAGSRWPWQSSGNRTRRRAG